MIDLGTLGGVLGQARWINNRGQVVGYSDLVGDQFQHAFLWDNGVLSDLGTLGGNFSFALWNNDNGDIVGVAGVPGDGAFPAVLWSHGKITNLGTLPGDNLANARSINSAQQIIGISCLLPCNTERAFLWEGGGPMVDLNALVQPPSSVVVINAEQIDDRGEIAAQGMLPNGDVHTVVLVPAGDCDSDCEQRIAASQKVAVGQPATTGAAIPAFGKPVDWLRNPFGQRFPMPGQRAVPSN
jgi:probable HAF family extracellular repeat protein